MNYCHFSSPATAENTWKKKSVFQLFHALFSLSVCPSMSTFYNEWRMMNKETILEILFNKATFFLKCRFVMFAEIFILLENTGLSHAHKLPHCIRTLAFGFLVRNLRPAFCFLRTNVSNAEPMGPYASCRNVFHKCDQSLVIIIHAVCLQSLCEC